MKPSKSPRKPVRKVSKKRETELRIYKGIVKAWKAKPENKFCRIDGCKQKAIDCHHSMGRAGKLLLMEAYFVPLCRKHHNRVKDDPEWAKIRGLLPLLPGKYNSLPK